LILNNKVTIVDFGMGNLKSVYNAFKYLGCEVAITSEPKIVEHSQRVVLPGVGSFRLAMDRLNQTGMTSALKKTIEKKNAKILGICLGLQLIGRMSTEDGLTQGLNFVEGDVEKFSPSALQPYKIPHVGFNSVTFKSESILFNGLSSPADFYFTHSYRMKQCESAELTASTTHGEQFVAAIEAGNVFATQFHPEKSQSNGLVVLKNFVDC